MIDRFHGLTYKEATKGNVRTGRVRFKSVYEKRTSKMQTRGGQGVASVYGRFYLGLRWCHAADFCLSLAPGI